MSRDGCCETVDNISKLTNNDSVSSAKLNVMQYVNIKHEVMSMMSFLKEDIKTDERRKCMGRLLK
jgi:hypothetical protein